MKESHREHDVQCPRQPTKRCQIYEWSLLIRILAAAVALTFALPLSFAFPLALSLALPFTAIIAFALIVLRRGTDNGRCGNRKQHCTTTDDPLQESSTGRYDLVEELLFAHVATSFHC